LVTGKQIRVGYFTPYLDTDKFGILQDGENWLKNLVLILMKYIKEPILRINPIQWKFRLQISFISVERIEGFY
jgi:hypothetical protein